MKDTDDWSALEFDARGMLCDTAAAPQYPPPPDYTWTLIEQWGLTAAVFGQNVGISTAAGYEYNLRTASDIWSEPEGLFVHVITERQWQEWQAIPDGFRPERPRHARAVPTRSVWVYHAAPPRNA